MAKAKLRRFGGTPVSEGVRLEVGKYTVFAVRNAQRDISVRLRREPRAFLRTCMRIPFLRGVARLFRDFHRFFDGINESSELRPHRPVRGTAADRTIARFLRVHPQTIVAWTSALLIPIIAFICLFAAPEGAEALLQSRFAPPRAVLNGIVCAVRILGALTAVFITCRLRVVNRLAMYKGALNKAINCYECHREITAENVRRHPLHTRRSEPAFLLCVMIISMILFSLVRTQGILLTLLVRVLIVLITASIINEPISAMESADLTLPVRIIRAPYDLLQHMTVLEPHPQMLEVVVCAFEAALDRSGKEVKEN